MDNIIESFNFYTEKVKNNCGLDIKLFTKLINIEIEEKESEEILNTLNEKNKNDLLNLIRVKKAIMFYNNRNNIIGVDARKKNEYVKYKTINNGLLAKGYIKGNHIGSLVFAEKEENTTETHIFLNDLRLTSDYEMIYCPYTILENQNLLKI